MKHVLFTKDADNLIEIHKLTSNDLSTFKELIEIFKGTFEGQSKKEINEFSLNTMLRRSSFLGFVAIKNNEVIGGLTAYELSSYYRDESEIFIYNLAVRPEFRRSGVGKILMDHILKFGKERKHSRIYVGAHMPNSNAIDFYRSTGATEYQVSKFVYHLDELPTSDSLS